MTITVYGIKSCDTCRKAIKELESNGLSVAFRDIRESPLSRSEIEGFFAVFGERLINKRSTTWRSLNDVERRGEEVELVLRHPALMKRPVIENGQALMLGWEQTAKSALLQ